MEFDGVDINILLITSGNVSVLSNNNEQWNNGQMLGSSASGKEGRWWQCWSSAWLSWHWYRCCWGNEGENCVKTLRQWKYYSYRDRSQHCIPLYNKSTGSITAVIAHGHSALANDDTRSWILQHQMLYFQNILQIANILVQFRNMKLNVSLLLTKCCFWKIQYSWFWPRCIRIMTQENKSWENQHSPTFKRDTSVPWILLDDVNLS